MNYSELLQLAKGWGNFLSDRIIIWRLRWKPSRGTAAGKTGGEAGKRDTAHHGGKSLCGRDYGKR